MAANEGPLVRLRDRLEQVLGPAEAATLMEHLPSQRPATKADLDGLRGEFAELRGEFAEFREEFVDFKAEVERRFEEVDRRFITVDHRFDKIELRFDELEKRLENRIDARGEILEHRLLGALSGVREDFAMQLGAQMRVFVFSTISALIALAALTLAFVRT